MFWLKERLTFFSNERKRFEKKLGYLLDLKNPKSYNEKICWKKIYDRNNLIPVTSDKYLVYDYIRNILGEDQIKLIPLLFVTDDPRLIPFDNLPKEYVIKANHGSGTNLIIEDGSKIEKVKIIKQCQKWLATPYGLFKHEWAYQKIKRKIIIQSLLRDSRGFLPSDYKIYVFHGKCKMIRITQDGMGEPKLNLYTPKWDLINAQYNKYTVGEKVDPPSKLEEMIKLAEILSAPFSFVRVDLYFIQDSIYFGELTHYPGSGMVSFNPMSFDFELGSYWHLKKSGD
ncbi:MAG: ATP-grasp fold amidoligase family protein [Gammaproteobacteria bacterium]